MYAHTLYYIILGEPLCSTKLAARDETFRVETESRKYLSRLFHHAFLPCKRQFVELGQVGSLRANVGYTSTDIYIYIYDNCTLLLLLSDEKETDAVGETEVRLNHCFWAAVNFRFRYTMTSAHCTLYPSAYPSPPSIVIDVAPRQGIKEIFDGSMNVWIEFVVGINRSILSFVHI